MANIIEINGNIFESNSQTIVNTVNCFGIMGKGLALEYKLRFPEMYLNYKDICDRKLLKVGTLQLWKNSTPWILNFPTKNHWKHPSKIVYIEQGLIKFSEFYRLKGINSIAFPQLGTQAGGLDWQKVRSVMYKHLDSLSDLDIEIYKYNSNANDSLFDRLYDIISMYDENDFKNNLKINKQQSQILIEALSIKSVSSMIDLQNLPSFGEKTLVKFYEFLNKSSIEDINDPQMSLF